MISMLGVMNTWDENKLGKIYCKETKIFTFDTGGFGKSVERVEVGDCKMGNGCLSYNRTKLDETQ